MTKTSRSRLRVGDVSLNECGGGRYGSRSISWNNSGSWLAAACSDHMARIWSVDGSQARDVTTLSGHTGPVDLVRFHPTIPSLISTAAQDRTFRVWDVRANGGARNIWKGDLVSKHPSMEWHEDEKMLVCVDKEDTIHIYDLKMNRKNPVKTINLDPLMVNECHFVGTKHLIAATRPPHGMGEIRIFVDWAGEEEKEPIVVEGHPGIIPTLKVSPDGSLIVTCGMDATVGLWDTETLICTHSIRTPKSVNGICFANDSSLVAMADDERVELADACNGNIVGSFAMSPKRGPGGAHEVAFHPKSFQLLAGARLDGGPVTVSKISWQ